MAPRPPIAVSVVIPTFNRPEKLRRCLSALAASTISPRDFEVVVVDDGSAEPLDPVVAQFRNGLDIQLHRQKNAGPAAARNAGAAAARASFLALTDDDCQPAPTWLAALLEGNRRTPEAALGGHTTNALADNPYAETSQLLLQYMYDRLNGDPERAAFFASNNFAVPKEGYLELGGFDRGFPRAAGEDRDFCERWSRSGRPLVYCPDAKVSHAHDLNFRTFWRQHFAYGRGAHQFRHRRSKAEGSRISFEKLDFYTGIFGASFRGHEGAEAARIAALLAVSQVANTAGFVWELVAKDEDGGSHE